LLLVSVQVLVWHARISELLCMHAFSHGQSQDDAFRAEDYPLETAI